MSQLPPEIVYAEKGNDDEAIIKAHHEAGHCVIGLLLGLQLDFMTIEDDIPKCVMSPEYETGLHSIEIAILFQLAARHTTARLGIDDFEDLGADSDLEKAEYLFEKFHEELYFSSDELDDFAECMVEEYWSYIKKVAEMLLDKGTLCNEDLYVCFGPNGFPPILKAIL